MTGVSRNDYEEACDSTSNNNLVKYTKASTAIVESKSIGEGTKIWHHTHIREQSKIGENCIIGMGVYIDKDVEIGNGVKIQNLVSIYKGVTLEDDVFVGPSVTFTNDIYPRSRIWSEEMIKPTIVRRGASIGGNSTIICGIEIGEYAMIGAGSIVSEDILPHSLVYGVQSRERGWVCYCGNPLQSEWIVENNDKKNVYKCMICNSIVSVLKK
jgi:UDP-2-acetamido-3-amino-2,3-dideoxy-glucuronate N-acetyltransferase